MADWGGTSFTPRIKWGSIPYIRIMNRKWIGALYKSGVVVVKQYFGSPIDMERLKADKNVVKVVDPFKANSESDALQYIKSKVAAYR